MRCIHLWSSTWNAMKAGARGFACAILRSLSSAGPSFHATSLLPSPSPARLPLTPASSLTLTLGFCLSHPRCWCRCFPLLHLCRLGFPPDVPCHQHRSEGSGKWKWKRHPGWWEGRHGAEGRKIHHMQIHGMHPWSKENEDTPQDMKMMGEKQPGERPPGL